jgi:transcriptional regulator with XRE-family HTH domain
MALPTASDIPAEMEAQGLTRYRLALEAGVNQSALSRYFSGKRGLNIDSMDKILDALGYRFVPPGKNQAVLSLKRAGDRH